MQLADSTRTYFGDGASTCHDESTASDLTSEISSASDLRGSLSHYEIGREIGRGKFSVVYNARKKSTGECVALKKVHIFEIMDSKARRDCINEVKILQSLEHPNIVRYYESFIENNEVIIAIEWAEAGDLGLLIRQRRERQMPLMPPEIWSYFLQVVLAVKHMHDRRMMHRDIKPSNIFVTAGGTLKLGDLGLSRYFSSKTLQAQSIVGTPYYMSPECIRGQPYDWSSDIWSLGCLLYELSTLQSPFHREGLNYYLLGKCITSCQYDSLPRSVPQPVRELVEAILVPRPADRPSIGQVLDYVQRVVGSRSTGGTAGGDSWRRTGLWEAAAGGGAAVGSGQDMMDEA